METLTYICDCRYYRAADGASTVQETNGNGGEEKTGIV